MSWNSKWVRKVICLCLALSVSAICFIPLRSDATTYSDLQKKSQQLKQQKEQAQQQLSQVKSQSQDVFQTLVDLQNQIEKIEEQSSSLVERRDLLEDQIASLDNQIKTLEQTITEERSNMESTLVTMYKWEKVAPSALVLVVTSSVNPELATYALQKVLSGQNDKLESYEDNVKQLQAKREELANAKDEVAQTIASLNTQLASLQSKYDERESLYAELKKEQSKYSSQLAMITQQQAEVSAEIERMLASTKVTSTSKSTGFLKPMSGVITSPFGWRINPLTGSGKDFHTGIDVANQYGTPIKASRTGKVIWAGWKTGYGLCVIIDHQDGYGTVYAHMSRIAVKSGQTISAGSVVGYEGSTGWATGPHLHFEIRIQGEPTNPAKFVQF
ncbi:murein hydrolase activator EnvC family protein [Coprothermobacter platensis]|uniref:murein hydrolase activator EnvC family protein n=1 Tax=Coprothermobacter platensis TaxID=108819 RepID=UPI00035D5502|nr:peptidoglycan DD-metalloendopeptidase family protein [Coprothermobacter platensis]